MWDLDGKTQGADDLAPMDHPLMTLDEQLAAGREREAAEAALMAAASGWAWAADELARLASAERAERHCMWTSLAERVDGRKVGPLERLTPEDVRALRPDSVLRSRWLRSLQAARDAERGARWPAIARHERRRLAARDRLVAHNLRLVRKEVVRMARRLPAARTHLADLEQAGRMALLRSADRYDARRGLRFSTYATWAVREAVADAAARHVNIVYVPKGKLGESASAPDGVAVRTRALPAGGEAMDVLIGTGEALTDVMERDELADALSRWLDRLPETEREALANHYGLVSDPVSGEEVGRRYGVTWRQVRNWRTSGLRRLREMAGSPLLEPDLLTSSTPGGHHQGSRAT